ncbi:bifunctional DNA-formamidopyrimidine glycosylase/DNA-(apurinic or apyrimidinic site) lyase [Desulfobulbus alkaliphilus]|uniref:bifunctional DNA-formamidopyrimidine glycosylase/DNA-(apurinic or apyrimidinic site) lyase n=1 Tax=Desulfobulbus alkaliphilus TaxID=869814 RepID=UPI0019652376|nr:bifunctional DNA-formamidopyrimidine glycosylase/DNA-(apurinic or apyrimidinic site) lyase [Desulfobulbus alkaliphilus]MBM9538113.1 bifunctional DNA-formamidopyrimidine glycosylase/DNA-(apurinic or apyrimidinic site) lyase [Desulfobulbus alkaliphilus]
MPELPEVEVTRRGLQDQMPGRTVMTLACSGHRLRTAMPLEHLQAHIARQQVIAIDRRAKYLLLRMASGAVLVIHLGMTGKIGLLPATSPRHRHDHLMLGLDNGQELRLNDSRRFGSVAVWSADEAASCEKNFCQGEGIEPFDAAFTGSRLLQLAASRRVPVKALLMNAKLVAGIGNIYANEILFAARVHPRISAGQLPGMAWEDIARHSRIILQQAIDAGGSTIADFLGSSGHPGYFQLQHQVYGRQGLPCRCCALPIVKATLAGRATYWCPACQPMMDGM